MMHTLESFAETARTIIQEKANLLREYRYFLLIHNAPVNILTKGFTLLLDIGDYDQKITYKGGNFGCRPSGPVG